MLRRPKQGKLLLFIIIILIPLIFFGILKLNIFTVKKVEVKNVVNRIPVANLYSIKDIEASTSSLIENIATPSASQKEESYGIDKEGVIFEKGNDLVGLPKVGIFGWDLSLGGNLPHDYLKKILKILEELKLLMIDNSQSFLFNNLLITSSIPKVIFRLDQDIDIQIASLQLIVQKAKIDESRLEFIDLRFDKPLIKIAPKN